VKAVASGLESNGHLESMLREHRGFLDLEPLLTSG
jgi:hypothetical protein